MKQVSTHKSFLVLCAALVFLSNISFGQTSVQNFGTGTGSQTSQTASTTFLPNPTSGTTLARAGTVVPNSPIVLSNTSNPLSTTGSYVRGAASAGGSVCKFSPWIAYTGSTEFYTSFKVMFGDASGGNTATSGTWAFYQGAGATFTNNSDLTGADVFVALRFTYSASGALTLATRQAATYSATGLTTASFSQGVVYTIEIVGNNKLSGTISYTYGGAAQTVAVQKLDLYINGTLVGNDLSKSELASGASITSGTFVGINSTLNAANIYVDDATVFNAVPAAIGSCTPPTISLNTATNPTCFGALNGSVSINPTGATSFLWSNGATTQNISGVGAGTYTVTATSTPGCTATLSQALTQPTQIVINAGSNSPICTGSNLNLTSNPSGGSGTYTTYAWSGPNGFIDANQSPTISAATTAATGSYTVIVTDGTGCTNSQTISATVNAVPTITFSPISPSFCDGSNVSVTVSGSTGFTWSPPTGLNVTTGATVIANPAATTIYTVSESGSTCGATATVTVTRNSNPAASCSSTNVSVLNGTDGTATVSPSGGSGTYTYSWTNTAQTTAAINGLAVNSYTATVTDGNGCTATCTSVVGQPVNALAASCSALNNVLCNGAATGSADVTASGGVPPYTYSWSNSATTSTISGLVAGTYTVTVTDAALTTISCSSTISQPTALSVTTAANVSVCTGGTFSLNGTVLGATTPYLYSWVGPNTYSSTSLSNTISNASALEAGAYVLTVTDANSCTGSSTTTVTVNSASISVSPTAATVCGGATTTLTASGGSTYVWSPASGLSATTGTSVDATPSTTTTYTVVGTDANSCTASAVSTITVTSIGLTVSPANYTLLSGRNVTITASSSGGTYLWSTAETTASINVNPTTTTAYTVTATSGACTASAISSITVVNSYGAGNVIVERTGDGTVYAANAAAPIFLDEYNSASSTPVKSTSIPALTGSTRLVISINSGTEGMITRSSTNQALVLAGYDAPASTASIGTTTSAVAPRVVNTVDYAQNIIRAATTTSFSGGSFRSAASDGINYFGTGSITGTLKLGTSGAATTIQSTLTNTRVVNIFNGQLYVSTGAGTTRGVYKIGSGIPTTSTTATLLISTGTAGSTSAYSINPASTVAYLADDAAAGIGKYTFNGTTWSLAYTIPTGGISTRGIVVDYSSTNPIIYGTSTESASNRLFKIIDIGASSTLVNIATAPTNMSFKGVSFAPECPTASKPTITVGTINGSCIGSTNGSIDITVAGGNQPYAYTWSNGSTLEDATGLAPNTYTVSVMDNSGCSNFTSVTVNTIATPTPTISGTTSICAGGSTTLDAGSYTSYLWSTGATTQTISANAAIAYTVTVTNASGCTGTASVTIGTFSSPTPTISGNLTFCTGGSVLLDAGAGYSSYLWSVGATTQTITTNSIGTYTVTVTNSNGCTGTANATVSLSSGLTPTIGGNTSYCQGGSTTIDAGTGYSSYLWSTGATTQTVSATAGTYTVTVSSGSCTGSTSVLITENPNPTVSIDPTSATICNGQSVSLLASGATNYTWNPSTGLSATNVAGVTASPTTNTIYTVVGTDGNGCTNSGTTSITVNALPSVSVTPVSQALCSGGSATLSASGSAVSFGWTPSTGLDVTAGSTVVSTVTATTIYTVIGTGSNGCTASATSTVIIIPGFTAPNAQGSYTYCTNAPATQLTASTSSANNSLLWYTVPSGGTGSTTAPTPLTTIVGTQHYYVSQVENTSSIKIAITGMIDNGTPDLFAFVALTDIPANTNIYFTDNGWTALNKFYNVTATDYSGGEDVCKFTSVLPISKGTVIQSYSSSLGYTWTTSGKINSAAATSASLNQYNQLALAAAGDQIYAFLSSNGNDPLNNPTTHLYVFDSSNGFEGATNANEGAVPPGLSAADGTAITLPHNNYYNLNNDNYIRTASQWFDYAKVSSNNYTMITGANASLPALGLTSFGIANACESPRTHITVNVHGPEFVATATSPVCEGGSITLTADLDYNYSVAWTGPNGFTSDLQEPAAISPATLSDAGAYLVIATDGDGCTASQTVNVVVSHVVATATLNTPILCNGGTASVTVTGSGGTAPYTGSGTFNLTAGTYNYTLTDATGCQGSTSITVTEPAAIVVTISVTAAPCPGGTGTVSVSATGGTGAYTGTGSFTVSEGLVSYIVTDANGCTGSASTTIVANASPTATVSPTSLELCSDGSNSPTNLVVTTAETNIVWNDPLTTTGNTLAVSYLGGALTYTATVTNSFGCTTSVSVPVTIISCSSGITLSTKVFIEGYSVGSRDVWGSTLGFMDNGGTGGLLYLQALSPDPLDVDDMKVSLMDPTTFAEVATADGVLKADGTLNVSFPTTSPGSYYIKLNHRSALETWSKNPVSLGSVATYDFSSGIDQAFGDNQTEVSPGVWAIYSGDINDQYVTGNGPGYQDGVVESADYGDMESANAINLGGYSVEDITGDGVVESTDYGVMENNNAVNRGMQRPY